MKQFIRPAVFLLLAAILFGSCTGVPDHARYIPADALVVAGVNTKHISREIAWSAITGSKILDDLNKEQEKQAARELDKAGIDWMSTSYAYVKAGQGPDGNTIIAGVLPLKNKAEWEMFVKKQFPGAGFTQVGSRTDASLSDKMYAGWTDHVLIVLNIMPLPGKMAGDRSVVAAADEVASTYGDTTVVADTIVVAPVTTPAVNMQAAMDSAFAITKERSVVQDKRFSKLEKQGHDITMWVNYERIMDRYMGNAMTKTMGLSLSNALWKGSAMASGIDFKKGKITADMLYYTSEGMKEIGRELGSSNADKDMIDRLPSQNMNMMMAWHMSPKATRAILDKSGFLGLINLALMSVGVGIDDILDTFTGDMAVSVCNFSNTPQAAAAADSVTHTGYTVSADYVYAMKIAKKENLTRLLSLAVSKEFLKPAGANMYQVAGETPAAFVLAYNDDYLVGANKAEAALAYLQSKNKGAKLPEEARKALYGHPLGGYFDMAAAAKTIMPPAGTEPNAAALADEAKKMLTDISFYGGGFSGDAFESHAIANFTNKEENALLQLLQFAVKAKNLAESHRTAERTAAPLPVDTAVSVP